jgi:hypothetical protein
MLTALIIHTIYVQYLIFIKSRSVVAPDRAASLSKRNLFEGAAPKARDDMEMLQTVSQNSFLIPISQMIAGPRVLSGAEVKKFAANDARLL